MARSRTSRRTSLESPRCRPPPAPQPAAQRAPDHQSRETPMLGYYMQLAVKSFGRSPGLTAVMVCAIALGIGVCVVTLTVYHAMSGNPIWWKNDRLYAVTMDSWAAERPAIRDQPQLPPWQLTYTDATYLFNSGIPERK